MTDAWTLLVSGSTLSEGDAWAHIGAQGGAADWWILADGLAIGLAPGPDVLVSTQQISVALASEVRVSVSIS